MNDARFTWGEYALLAVAVLCAIGTVGLLAGELVAGDYSTLQARTTTLAIDGLVIWAVWATASLRAVRRRVAALHGRALTEQWGPR